MDVLDVNPAFILAADFEDFGKIVAEDVKREEKEKKGENMTCAEIQERLEKREIRQDSCLLLVPLIDDMMLVVGKE